MKKRLVLVVALILIATMVFVTGCGKKEEPKPEPQAEAQEEAEEEAEEEAAEEAESVVPEELLGETNGSTYVNDFFGFRLDAPDNWYLLEKSELMERMGLAASSADASMAEILENTGYAMDLYGINLTQMAENPNAYDNVNATIQDIGKIYGIIYNEKQIAEASVETIKQTLAAQGVEVVSVDVGESSFIGKNCVSMTIVSKAGDITMYQKQVYLKNGSALACITATTFTEDRTDEVLAMFKAE